MKKLLFGLIFIGLGIGSMSFISGREKEANNIEILKHKKIHNQQVMDNTARDIINKAKSIEDLERAEAMVSVLSKSNYDRLSPYISLKKSSIWFDMAEDCLKRAIEIEIAGSPPAPPAPPPAPPQPVDPNNPNHEPVTAPAKTFHPLTLKVLDEAMDFYERARKESEKLADIGEKDFDYHLNYLKGEIYYRFLEILSTPETAQELFNQSVTYYKYALRHRPNDINTVINIELLIKNQNRLLSGAGNPAAKKTQMLNSKKFGINKSTGN